MNWFRKIAKIAPPFEISGYIPEYGELRGYFRDSGTEYIYDNITPDDYRRIRFLLSNPKFYSKAIFLLRSIAEQNEQRKSNKQTIETEKQEQEDMLLDAKQQMAEEDASALEREELVRSGEITDD